MLHVPTIYPRTSTVAIVTGTTPPQSWSEMPSWRDSSRLRECMASSTCSSLEMAAVLYTQLSSRVLQAVEETSRSWNVPTMHTSATGLALKILHKLVLNTKASEALHSCCARGSLEQPDMPSTCKALESHVSILLDVVH